MKILGLYITTRRKHEATVLQSARQDFLLEQTDYFLAQERKMRRADASVINSQRTEIERLWGRLAKFQRPRDANGRFKKENG